MDARPKTAPPTTARFYSIQQHEYGGRTFRGRFAGNYQQYTETSSDPSAHSGSRTLKHTGR